MFVFICVFFRLFGGLAAKLAYLWFSYHLISSVIKSLIKKRTVFIVV